ncbi:hypothetical protein DM01DRAFT_1332369 [Hesseltinella vesiculosa]|uniref:SNARE-complex protein Syntaxin-18 N-terminal domain-containing protein n=1 Tax=Hesseltinella vesiculosa TaxID=101127 RepID=A0A1X2GUT9_9FUNG|nr:hypothetical protein DM01DRAFT_1332369 [Hesseltinella vesiculosa]
MPDITGQFHAIIQANPPPPTAKNPIPQRPLREKGDYDVFTKEAYRIYFHIDSLARFLKAIRRVYIQDRAANDKTPAPEPQPSRPKRKKRLNQQPDDDQDDLHSLFAQFPQHLTHLNDQERDNIDFQAKLLIRRCMDRVKDMEEAERIRCDQVQRQKQGWKRLLASPFDTTEDTLAMHRSNMIWSLNKCLMDVSKLQKDQQQTRLERILAKSQNHLFSNTSAASSTLLQPQQPQPAKPGSHSSTSLTGLSPLAFMQRTVSQPTTPSPPPAVHDDTPADDEDDDELLRDLSAEQLQVLEKENESMLEEMNSTLNEVHQAEKALVEISTLQTQLANHLAAQTIQTDQLYGDSLATNERMEQGNVQLLQAKERNKGTRKFMVIFLFGASLVLLFLDWYS